jgi:hypothetical protein
MPADPETAGPEFSPQQQREAIAEACRVLACVQTGEIRRGAIRRSIGIQVSDQDGRPSWLKIVALRTSYDEWARNGELSSRSMVGVPMPRLLRDFEMNAGGLRCHALQFSQAPSPVILDTPWIVATPLSIDEEWLAKLKHAVDRISSAPLTRWLIHPGAAVRIIAQRFGRKAPHTVDEWRPAHGDLNWSNLTAPDLTLLDWERWGAAPRGFDAATLLSFSARDADLFHRIEALFADDLNTTSGVVARLFQYARRLARLDAAGGDPVEHRRLKDDAARLLRR